MTLSFISTPLIPLGARSLTRLATAILLSIFTTTVLADSGNSHDGNFTLNNSVGGECVAAGGALSTTNLFTDLDNGSFGTGSGAPDEIPEDDPYGSFITGGVFINSFRDFTWGNYSYISNLQEPRNKQQHSGGIYDPVNGKTGRFFVSDPNSSTPTLSHSLAGLKLGESYEISFWAADSELGARYFNRIGIFANDVEVFNTGFLKNKTKTMEWKKYSFVYTHTADDSLTNFDIRSLETGSSGRDFYLDEIKIHQCYTDGVIPPAEPPSPSLEIAACTAIEALDEKPDGLEDLSFPKGYWAASYYAGTDSVQNAVYTTGSLDADGKPGEKVFKGEAFWGADGSTTVSINSQGSAENDRWSETETPTWPNLHHPDYTGSIWKSSGNPFYQIDMRQKMTFRGEVTFGYGENEVLDDVIEVFVNGVRVYAYFPGGGAPNSRPGEGNGVTLKVEANDEVMVRFINWGNIGGFNFELSSPMPDCSDSPEDGTEHPSGATNNYGSAPHSVDTDVRLGGKVDSESAPIHSDEADADGADDDGITHTSFIPGESTTITAKVTGQGGYLQGWIDWDGDGSFNSFSEQVANDLQDGDANDLSDVSGVISFDTEVPRSATNLPTIMRFRWSTESGLASTGHARDGESEDYQVTASSGPMYCDMNGLSNATYPTASVSANSPNLSAGTLLYQATFNRNNWHGDITAYNLKTADSDGNIKSVVWNATDMLGSSTRNIITYNNTGDSTPGAKFQWNKLNATQKQALRHGSSVSVGKKRLNWVKGNTSQDGNLMRNRDSVMGDIVHSNLNFRSSIINFGYKQLSGSEGSSYAAYLVAKRATKDTLFVGANDGMLHAFDAENGEELFGYVPNNVFPKLANISNPKYGCSDDDCLPHEYLVDGRSTVADAYFDGQWHTVLVGTLGLGGKAIYALDVSDPETFNKNNVLWEISDTQAADSADTFASHMGLSTPEPVVVKMKNGQWAAIVANGYESSSNQAVLFIIDIETGDLIKTINTGVGSDTAKNGLSSPTAVDSDGDYIADTIYAGDLQGNLWAFDVSSADPDSWDSKYGTSPLFRACMDASCALAKRITAKPQVGRNPSGGMMVYVGTGKYTDVGDNFKSDQSGVVDSVYGLHDNGQAIVMSNLVEQEILEEIEVSDDLISRVTSTNQVDYSSKQGWYMDLVTPPNDLDEGERVISQPLLREGRLIFTTLVPSQFECAWSGSSWLMELNALDGARLSEIPLDLNKDKAFTELDNVEYDSSSTIISGVKQPSLGMIFDSPAIINHSLSTEGKYLTGTDGIGMFKESSSRFSGRMSWKKLK